jgi:hypothetical protein
MDDDSYMVYNLNMLLGLIVVFVLLNHDMELLGYNELLFYVVNVNNYFNTVYNYLNY